MFGNSQNPIYRTSFEQINIFSFPVIKVKNIYGKHEKILPIIRSLPEKDLTLSMKKFQLHFQNGWNQNQNSTYLFRSLTSSEIFRYLIDFHILFFDIAFCWLWLFIFNTRVFLSLNFLLFKFVCKPSYASHYRCNIIRILVQTDDLYMDSCSSSMRLRKFRT